MKPNFFEGALDWKIYRGEPCCPLSPRTSGAHAEPARAVWQRPKLRDQERTTSRAGTK